MKEKKAGAIFIPMTLRLVPNAEAITGILTTKERKKPAKNAEKYIRFPEEWPERFKTLFIFQK